VRLVRGSPIILVISLSLVTAPSASGDETIAMVTRPTSVSAYGGRVVWSSFDSTRGVYVLMTRFAGTTLPVSVRARSVPFDVDLGPGEEGGTVAAYSRCRREPPRRHSAIGNVFTQLPDWARGRGCDLYQFDFDTGRQTRIASANSPGASEYMPSIWNDRVAFARVYERKRGRAGKRPYLYVRSMSKSRRSLRIPAGTRSTELFCSGRPRRCRLLVEPGPTALDLAGRHLALGWDTGAPDTPGSAVYLETVGTRRATKALIAGVSSGGVQNSEIESPAIVDAQLYWTLALFGHDTGNTLLRYGISTRERSEAPIPPPAVQAQDAWLRGAFATAVSGADVFYLISGQTESGEPCTPQQPCSTYPGCSDAEPCPLRSTSDIVFRPDR
jgi:hypothetical protein